MLVGLHEGMLTLAGLSLLVIVAAKLYRKLLGRILYIDIDKIIDYIEPATVLGAIGGVSFLIASIYLALTLLIGGAGSLVNSPLLMNKVMMSALALETWIIFLIIRAIHGRKIWNQGALSAVYAAIGITGFLLVMETGSLGGHLAGKGSILDPIYEMFNIDPEKFFALGTLGTYAVLGICIFALVVYLYVHRKS
jgi:hypothetical protein